VEAAAAARTAAEPLLAAVQTEAALPAFLAAVEQQVAAFPEEAAAFPVQTAAFLAEAVVELPQTVVAAEQMPAAGLVVAGIPKRRLSAVGTLEEVPFVEVVVVAAVASDPDSQA